MKKLHIYTAIFCVVQLVINVAFLFSIMGVKDRLDKLEDNRIRLPNIQIGGR